MISDLNASSTESANNILSETPLQHSVFCTEFFFFFFFIQPSNKRRAVICAHHLMYTVHTHDLKCGYIFINYGHLWTLISAICTCGCMWVCPHYVVHAYLSVQQYLPIEECVGMFCCPYCCLPLSTQPNLVYFGWIPTPQI